MPRSTFGDNFLSPGFIADANSIVRRQGGVQIDWENVPDTFIPEGQTGKEIPAGYVLCEPDNFGQAIPRPVDDSEDAVGLLETNANENDQTAAKSGYGLIVGGGIIESRLPLALTSTVKTELQAAGSGFAFQVASNSLSE